MIWLLTTIYYLLFFCSVTGTRIFTVSEMDPILVCYGRRTQRVASGGRTVNGANYARPGRDVIQNGRAGQRDRFRNVDKDLYLFIYSIHIINLTIWMFVTYTILIHLTKFYYYVNLFL